MDATPQFTVIELLEQIVKRPGMYWGDSDNNFHSLVAFFSGYQIARGVDRNVRPEHPLDAAIPEDFHQFVTEHFGHKFPYGGHGWTSLIEENSDSARQALDMFLDLRRIYEQKPSANKP